MPEGEIRVCGSSRSTNFKLVFILVSSSSRNLAHRDWQSDVGIYWQLHKVEN